MTWEGVIFLTQFEKVDLCCMDKIYSKHSLWHEVVPLGIRAKLNIFPWRLLASPLGKESSVQQIIFQRKKKAINNVLFGLFEQVKSTESLFITFFKIKIFFFKIASNIICILLYLYKLALLYTLISTLNTSSYGL